jgi:uncharacterized protein YbjQ (UPF0145 family)
MINNQNIKDIYGIITGTINNAEVIEDITKRLELVIEQMNVQEEFNKKMDEISEKASKLKK